MSCAAMETWSLALHQGILSVVVEVIGAELHLVD